MADFLSPTAKSYILEVRYRGAGAVLFVDGKPRESLMSQSKSFQTFEADIELRAGSSRIELVYFAASRYPALHLLIDGSSSVEKFLRRIGEDGTTMEATPTPTPTLNIAEISPGPGTDEKPVVPIPEEKMAERDVSWEQTQLREKDGKPFKITTPTAVKLGPDLHYYITTQFGSLYRVRVDSKLTVQSSCSTKSLKRAMLGLAFDHSSNDNSLYVSTSALKWGKNRKYRNRVDAWTNGRIERYTVGCGCMCHRGAVVTGLPVSNNNHGVNSLLVKDGKLYIVTGGATNGGHNTPGNRLGGSPESPLSGAVLVANLRKPDFDGKILYDRYDSPEEAQVISGDVTVFASGLRNSFGLNMRMNGDLWGTDNGGNPEFGDEATGCGLNDFGPFVGKSNDKILHIEKGKYYGHPNRPRGECSPTGATPAVQELPPSVNGVVEYGSNVFGDNLRGQLIFTKYAGRKDGAAYSGRVLRKGGLMLRQMTEYSGVSVDNGMFGELVMTRVYDGVMGVLRPKVKKNELDSRVLAVSPNRGVAGKTVLVTGERFEHAVKVRFGNRVAEQVQKFSRDEILVKVPENSERVVKVTVRAGASPSIGFVNFRYEG